MLKMGLEKEFFCLKAGEPVIVPAEVSADECGWLAEARGDAFTNIVDAVYSLKSAVHKLQKGAKAKGITLADIPVMSIPRSIRIKAARNFSKGTISYQNLYGYDSHKNTVTEAVAGVHLSFTNPRKIIVKDTTEEYNANFDWAQIFITLDKAFEKEIKAAKRRPGFYEIKSDGRIEYRSLPSNVNLDKVIDVVTGILNGKSEDEEDKDHD